VASDEGLGDEEPTPPLLPPDDRIWRHPSEVGELGSPRVVAPGAATSKGGRRWPIGVGAWLLGGVVTAAIIGAWGGLDGVRTVAIPAVEQVVAPGLSSPMSAPWEDVVGIADHMSNVVVRVMAESPNGDVDRASGLVFRSDGHVLTNHHVVDGTRRITVVMANGRREAARLVGSDAETDIAVIKVDGQGLASAVMGSAASLRVGQMAMALGAADDGDRPAVSIGLVNALGRRVSSRIGADLIDMIQTSLPVVATSSGGPLVDAAGAVIGITTDLSGSNPTDGRVGFATPIDAARDVAVQLIARGRVTQAWLGIEGEDLDAAAAGALGLVGGARVKAVRPGSPASKEGIEPGEVITSVEGLPVSSMGGLKARLRSHRPGETVRVGVAGEGGARTVRIALASRP